MILGGNKGIHPDPFTIQHKSVLRFDPATNTFDDMPSLKKDRSWASCTVFYSQFHNGRPVVLVAGGYEDHGRDGETAELFDFTNPNAEWTLSKISFVFSTFLKVVMHIIEIANGCLYILIANKHLRSIQTKYLQ